PKQAYGWAQMTNGLVSADAWVFIFSHNLKEDPHPKWTAELPKEEEVVEFDLVPNTFYHKLTKLRLVFNEDPNNAETLDLKAEISLQKFPLKPHKCKKITLEPLAWEEVGSQPVISIENIWVRVKRSDDYKQTVVPLLNIGALVKYKMGEGGILLDQLKIQETEANPVNAEKKQTITATLLRNLGAAFAGGRTLAAGAGLKYAPVPLGDKCNQFLTRDKGWYAGDADLAAFPVGENTLAGVAYAVRDF